MFLHARDARLAMVVVVLGLQTDTDNNKWKGNMFSNKYKNVLV